MCAVLLGVAAAVSSCKTVAAGRVSVLERSGSFYRELYPGVHWINPFADRIRPVFWPGYNAPADTMPLTQSAWSVLARTETRDGQTVTLQTVVFFTLQDASSAAYTQLPLAELLETHARDILTRLVHRLTWEELFTVSPPAGAGNDGRPQDAREALQTALTQELNRRAQHWGLSVEQAEITQIVPGAELVQLMQRRLRELYAGQPEK